MSNPITGSSMSVPSHVPSERVFDFNIYDIPGAQEDYQAAWKRLHAPGVPDIIWSPHNGGHWLPTRGADIYAFFKDVEHLSTSHYVVPKQAAPFRFLPVSIDPPEHTPYRAAIQGPLTPKAVNQMEGFARATIRERIAQIRHTGECEFITQFANHVPVQMFLKMTELPASDHAMLLAWAEVQTGVVKSGNDEARIEATQNIRRYAVEKIRERRGKVGTDRLSQLVNARIDGQPISDEELTDLCSLLLIGGLDTVASMVGFVMRFLARHPEHRRQLIAHPELMPRALDEFLRRFGVTLPGRIVRHDFVYKGVSFKAGDMVILATMLHGVDDRAFANPLEIDFHRSEPPIYSTFGNGPHRCPGSFLARSELRIILEEWLAAIPEFRLKEGDPIHTRTGLHGTLLNLPLVWDIPR